MAIPYALSKGAIDASPHDLESFYSMTARVGREVCPSAYPYVKPQPDNGFPYNSNIVQSTAASIT